VEKPRKEAGHMTAPASTVQKLQKDLANGAPSTHDPMETNVARANDVREETI
jgi:hypothetical protein